MRYQAQRSRGAELENENIVYTQGFDLGNRRRPRNRRCGGVEFTIVFSTVLPYTGRYILHLFCLAAIVFAWFLFDLIQLSTVCRTRADLAHLLSPCATAVRVCISASRLVSVHYCEHSGAHNSYCCQMEALGSARFPFVPYSLCIKYMLLRI